MIEALRAQLTPAGMLSASQAEVDAKLREWREEQPECFDPSL